MKSIKNIGILSVLLLSTLAACDHKTAVNSESQVEERKKVVRVETASEVTPTVISRRQQINNECMKGHDESHKRYCECYTDEVLARLEKKGGKSLQSLNSVEKGQVMAASVMSCKRYSQN